MNLRLQPLTEREEFVLRMHEEDKQTCRQIGAQLGVTHHRAQQILRSARLRRKDYAENKDEALSLLPSRVTNVLGWLNLGTSRAEVRAAIETERLHWQYRPGTGGALRYDGRHVRNLGWKSWVVLNEWAGLPHPERTRPTANQDLAVSDHVR